jgi:hypothetical protein
MRGYSEKPVDSRHVLKAAAVIFIGTLSCTALANAPTPGDPMLLNQDNWPTIEADIQSLSGFGARAQAAGERLVERGQSILPAAHAALEDPATNMPLKMQLVTVLGEVGAAESADVLITVAETYKGDRYLYQNTLLALAKLPPDKNAAAFADRQLSQPKNDPLILRSALWYHAQRPSANSAQWAAQYDAPQASPAVRYAGLYLAASLGDVSVRDALLEMLHSGQTPAREEVLLQGLAEIVGPAELKSLLRGLPISAAHRDEALRLSTLRHGSAAERTAIAQQMLESGSSLEKESATRFFVSSGKVEPLATSWQQGNKVVRSAVRRVGFEVHSDAQGAHLEPIAQDSKPPLWLFVIGALLIVMFGMGVRLKMRKQGRHEP